MYIVRDIKTKEIIHKNMAPTSQNLGGEDVYYKFNPKTMEIGRIDGELPDSFDISEDGEIIPLSIEEKVEQGILKIAPEMKVENNEIVEKTLEEKVADGVVKLEPGQKVVNESIEQKTLQEMMDDGELDLDAIKNMKLDEFRSQSLTMRNELLPDYKIQNALLGLYSDDKAELYKSVIEEFRKEYDRLKKKVEKAKTIEEIESVEAKFPTSIK